MAVLKLEGIEKKLFRQKILQDISIEVEEQSFTSILGPVGAGKTTLLRIIAGFTKPTKGRVYLKGKDITDVPPQKRKIAMAFQAFSLYPNLTVYENIASPLRAIRRPEMEIKEKVITQAKMLGIDSLLDKRPYELSGGESQRVSIGRALIKNADVYLFDEPLTNLDYKLRESMTRELRDILTAKGFEGTIIYATPNYEEALSMSTETVLLKEGKVIWSGPTLENYLTPPCITFAKHFSSPPMNLFECRLSREKERIYLSASQQIQLNVTHLKDLLHDNRYILGLQPHDLHVEKETSDMISIDFHLILAEVTPAGTVLHLEHEGKKVSGYLFHPQDFKEKSLQLFVYPQNFFIYSKKTGELITRYRSPNNGQS